MMKRRNADVLRDTFDFAGKRVIDVGCGDGSLARMMTRAGAHVTGIEVNPDQLARARAATPAGDETYVEAGAEALPFPDVSADIVVFFNSLHHVPVERQGEALAEASRVLRPGGFAYVCEPVAEGSFFDLVRRIDDETRVRAKAYAEIKAAGRHGFEPVSETAYVHEVRRADFDEFRLSMTAVDPARAASFAAHEAELRELFERLGDKRAEGVFFDQPMRVNVLRKA